MRGICVDNSELEHSITLGKYYDIIEKDILRVAVWISNDSDHEGWFYANRFKMTSEIRNEKLNELGI